MTEPLSPRKRKKNENTIGVKSRLYYKCLGERESGGAMKLFYECKFCFFNVNGHKEHNLASHLQHIHPEVYALIIAQKDSMPVKRLKLLHNAVETVSVNGRPFKWILDSGYQENIKSKLRKLREAGEALNLTDTNLKDVKKHLHTMAEKVRQKIENETKDRALSLLVDIVK